MSVALFLDVDKTLTVEIIQRCFASILNVRDQYEQAELAFQTKAISSDEFARRIIDLFNSAGFTESLATEWYPKIELAPWAGALLQLPVQKYLVSSGPSYYVHRLAEAYDIPLENVLCSAYSFNQQGKLDGCNAVSYLMKSRFVQEKRPRHKLSLGLGDSLDHDGPFISACDFPMILRNADAGYPSCSDLSVVHAIVQNLSKLFTVRAGVPQVAIFSSSQSQGLANTLQTKLEQGSICEATVWADGMFRPSQTVIQSLLNASAMYDFAVFLMAANDIQTINGHVQNVVRDNVLFELGLFCGALGLERCFLVRPEQAMHLPSDLQGVVYLTYDEERALKQRQPDPALNPATTTIKSAIEELGCRDS